MKYTIAITIIGFLMAATGAVMWDFQPELENINKFLSIIGFTNMLIGLLATLAAAGNDEL